MSTFSLWDRLAALYGSPTANPSQYSSALGSSVSPYMAPRMSAPATQAPVSPLVAVAASSSPPATATPAGSSPSASPNYLGMVRQGASTANAMTGGDNAALGDLSNGIGAYQGINSGTPQGYAGAAVDAGKIANNLGAFGDDSSAAGAGLGAASGALGIYSGLQQGGAGGDLSAGLGAAQLANEAAMATGAESAAAGGAMAGTLGAAGIMAAPIIMGLTTDWQTTFLQPKYWEGLAGALQGQGTNANSGPGGGGPDAQKYAISSAVQEALSTPPEEVPPAIKQMVWNTGLVPYGTWNDQGPVAPVAVGGAKSGSDRRNVQAARGGSMKKSPIQSRLRHLYEGSFAGRKRHFDDGGGVGSYYDSAGSWYTQNPSDASNIDTSQFYTPSQNDINNELSSANQEGVDTINNPYGAGPSSSSSNSGILGALGVSSIGQFLQKYGALAPLIAAAVGGNKPASAPATPAGYGPIPSIPTPANNRTYTQPNVANWYTYGQGPEASFFSNNQLPTVPGVSPGTGAAGTAPPTIATPGGQMATQPIPVTGGNLRPVMRARGGAFDSTAGDSYVADPGHGDGTSDDIDAKLSGGEYVMDAGTVSMLGNGSNEAGSRALDQLRQRVRKHAGKQLVKGKQFMKAKAPEKYLASKGGA